MPATYKKDGSLLTAEFACLEIVVNLNSKLNEHRKYIGEVLWD